MLTKNTEDGCHPVPRNPQAPQPAVVAPSLYHNLGNSTSPILPILTNRAEVEAMLTDIWGHPAVTVLMRVGGGRSAYSAHDDAGHFTPLDYHQAHGFTLPDDTMADYRDYLDTKFAALRGVL